MCRTPCLRSLPLVPFLLCCRMASSEKITYRRRPHNANADGPAMWSLQHSSRLQDLMIGPQDAGERTGLNGQSRRHPFEPVTCHEECLDPLQAGHSLQSLEECNYLDDCSSDEADYPPRDLGLPDTPSCGHGSSTISSSSPVLISSQHAVQSRDAACAPFPVKSEQESMHDNLLNQLQELGKSLSVITNAAHTMQVSILDCKRALHQHSDVCAPRSRLGSPFRRTSGKVDDAAKT